MSRKVKIYSDTEKGCIFFDGSTVEPKFIGTIIATAHPTRSDRVIIKRTDRLQTDGVSFRVLFRKLAIGRLQNRDAEDLVDTLGMDRDEVVTYINEQANDFQGASAVRPGLDDHPNFDLDPTSTSIIVDNGEHFGVNTIKAILGPDNLVDIVSSDFSSNNITYFEDCPPENLQIKGSFIGGGPNDVVNALNELFTVGAFESVVISDPFSTVIADVNGVDAGYTLEGADAIDPEGDDIFTYDGVGYANYAGLKSVATIDQVGEYYTFDIRGEGTIGFGLVHSDASFAAGKFSGNSNYADPDSFAAVNSAHYGFQFSHWFHGTPNGSWTNYGANTGYSMRAGWSNFNGTTEQADWLAGNPIKVRCGIDANGFISIETLRDGSSWEVHARSSYPVPEGGEYHLGIKSQSTAARVYSAPKVHLQVPEAPTLHFRYIESPDGAWSYPLFATAEESDYYELTESGVDNGSHTHVYPDDPTNTIWHMPNTAHSMNHGLSPVGQSMTFEGNAINWTEITSLSNADLVPSAFSGLDQSVDELESVNIQTQPQDTAYTTTITGLPPALVDAGGGMIQGTAPEVTGDNVANPSDSFTVTVTRTNSYGSSVGTFELTVNNLTAPATLPSGYTQLAGSFTDNGDGTYSVDNSSVVQLDLSLEVGKRVIIPSTWANDNVLPFLDHTQSESKAFFGIADVSPNWSNTPDLHDDFDAVVRWEAINASSHKHSMSVGDLIGANHNTVGSASVSYWNYAIEWDGTELHVLRNASLSDLQSKHRSELPNVISDEPATSRSGTLPLVVATRSGGSMNLTTSGLSIMSIPAEPVVNLTPWTKALDFSGSNEHLKQVSQSTQINALRMGGKSVTVPANPDSSKTSNDSEACPWATAVVFKPDGNNSNQHIWNIGEGAGSNDDNIYLRMDGSRGLYFGWGRDGAMNECKIHNYLPLTMWCGVYVGHNGTRLSGNNATAANLASAFDIRLTFDSNWSNLPQMSTSQNWTNGSTGGRMDRSVTGDFTIGGRGSNRNFHGKVASMVVTTLRSNFAMPTDAEIELMITDPKKWEDDYRIGQLVRWAYSTSITTYNPSNYTYGYGNTHIWLMGDGTSDNYSNMIRNDVHPSDQNYTKMNMISMVSNDIQNVTIPGLS